MQWSSDLLGDAEKSLLSRCSVFAGGFDLPAAHAVAGSDDEFETLDLLDALVRKSLLVADRSAEQRRFSMLETIRQFGEEQLTATGEAKAARTAHARHFAEREADVLALWDSPRQREASRHRGRDRQCHVTGRIDDAVGYLDAGHAAIESGRFDDVRREFEGILAGAYLANGQLERCVEVYRNIVARSPGGACTVARSSLALALTIAGAGDEAMAVSEGLIATDATDNPHVVSWALFAYGFARGDADPELAYDVLRRGLRIAQESGNRRVESILTVGLSRLAATHADPTNAFHFLSVAIRNLYDSGSFSILPTPLAVLAAIFDRLGHHEPAATICGFAATPLSRTAFPEINRAITHLRELLGDEVYESFARASEHMTNATMATYALDQIDQARAGLLRAH
ncbi:MAG TPA: hypothetical protein VF874_08065 [Mycobacterium sp.]